MDWMPIETAPKDVTILVYDPYDGIFTAVHDYGHMWFPACSGDDGPTLTPTHWMPLPKPPAIAMETGTATAPQSDVVAKP